MRHVRRISRAVALSLAAVVACAAPGPPGPAGALATARAALDARQYAAARDAFRDWLSGHREDARGWLGLAAAFEGLDQLDSARAVYTRLLAGKVPESARRELTGRLGLLARRALVEAAHAAVANEATLSALPPTPHTIAVLPFRYLGGDPQLRPLGRGIAQLVVDDLSKVGSLRLLERQAVQQLLDEMRLTAAGLVDPATGARPGRLLRAEHVIEGSFEQLPDTQRLRLDGSAVTTATATVAATASADDRLRQLFDIEKAVVFQLLDQLGIPLTAAERARIAERPTASLQAFLAFSRGLAAEDGGDFPAALRAYQAAARLDASFQLAAQHAGNVGAMIRAQRLSLVGVATMLDPRGVDLAFLTDQLNYVMGSGMTSAERAGEALGSEPPGGRDPVGDVGGGDRLGGIGQFVIIVRRP